MIFLGNSILTHCRYNFSAVIFFRTNFTTLIANDRSYTVHYKLVKYTATLTEVENGCDAEASKYKKTGYEDIPITLPAPKNDAENAQMFQMLQASPFQGIWLDFAVGKRQAMRKSGSGGWSDNEESDNSLVCVFVDYTDLSDSVCTTVS